MRILQRRLVRVAAAMAVALAVIGLGVVTPANGAVVHTLVGTVENGVAVEKLFFASGVIVDGGTYTVSFLDGTCIDTFSGCDELGDFDFTTLETANLAAQALLNQVFVDVPVGAFDSEPELTRGCTFIIECTAFIPFGFIGNEINPILWRGAQNHSPESNQFDMLGGGNLDPNGDRADASVWARFALTAPPPVPSPVPLPGALPLFLSALAGLGLMGWRRRTA